MHFIQNYFLLCQELWFGGRVVVGSGGTEVVSRRPGGASKGEIGMKTRFFGILGVLLAVVAVCGQRQAKASLAVGNTVQINQDGCSFEDGGEFQVNVWNTPASTPVPPPQAPPVGYTESSFATFCASVNLAFTPGVYYTVTSLSTVAFDSTPIGKEATWLFNKYTANTSTTLPGSWNGYVP